MMKMGRLHAVTASITGLCMGLLVVNFSQAAGQVREWEDWSPATIAVADAGTAKTKKFTVPTFEPTTAMAAMAAVAAAAPFQPLRLATLMPSGKQRFDWRQPSRFSKQKLMNTPLADLRRGKAAVPPVYLGRFPAKLADTRDAKQRKAIFIKTVLPLVLRVNDEVRATRQRMLSLLQRQREQDDLSSDERAFLKHLTTEYDVQDGDYDELRRRVDVVPVSLALAQGAEESGWGTSRFARVGNAVFGQRTFRKGHGLVPLKREAGERYEVKAFGNLYTSVHSYIRNLNTHVAYKKFRDERAAKRAAGLRLDSYELIGTMKSYSERGQKYINTIRVILRANRMHEFDSARLLSSNSDFSPS